MAVIAPDFFMSFTTLIGVLFGFSLLIHSIALSTNIYLIFVRFSSALMVNCGTLLATLIGQKARNVWLVLLCGGHVKVAECGCAQNKKNGRSVRSDS